MFGITERALLLLRESAWNPAAPRRIHLSPRGCTLPKVVITEERPGESDILLQAEGYTFFMAPALHERVQGVELDVMYGELSVNTGVPYRAEGCGVCPAAAVNGGQCGRAAGVVGHVRHA